MSTGYTLEAGYNSGYMDASTDGWVVLSELVETILENEVETIPEKLIEKIKLFGFNDEMLTLIPFTQGYLGSAVKVNEEMQCMFLSASGGDPARRAKEQIALGFCAYVFEYCALRGVPISITIT